MMQVRDRQGAKRPRFGGTVTGQPGGAAGMALHDDDLGIMARDLQMAEHRSGQADGVLVPAVAGAYAVAAIRLVRSASSQVRAAAGPASGCCGPAGAGT